MLLGIGCRAHHASGVNPHLDRLPETQRTAARFRQGKRTTVHFGLLAPLLILCGFPGHASADTAPPPHRYLPAIERYTDLGYNLPPPPVKGSAAWIADLKDVQMRSKTATPAARADAFADAEAYPFDALLPRFTVAAGRTLNVQRRPILAHMLRWILADADHYSDIKDINKRPRPLTEDPAIDSCDKSFMMDATRGFGAYTYSYPSGHSENGELAALLLAQVMPDRSALLRARGENYGDNRVVCGVHYPTDVRQGREFAKFLFARITAQDAYKADLVCAIEEDHADQLGELPNRKSGAPKAAYSPTCAQLDQQYFAEMVAL